MDKRIVNYYLLLSILDSSKLPIESKKNILEIKSKINTDIILIHTNDGYIINESIIGATEHNIDCLCIDFNDDDIDEYRS
jgi:hypothetical protein